MANKENKATEVATGMSRGVKILVAAMVVVMVAAIAVAVWAIFFREDTVIIPDYAPPEKEEHAEKIEGEDNTKLDAPEGGGAVELLFSYDLTVDLSDEQASLFFGNPGKSTQLMVVQIVVHDTVIAQSGTLEPGYRIQKLNLLQGAAKQLAPGGYDGKMLILYYDLVTKEKAMLQSEIPLTVNVQE